MNQRLLSNKANTYKSTTTDNSIMVVKEAFVKPCKHRTGTGFCIRSNRQCPATIFNLSINK
ncbi:hypothetical protein BH10BAC2_BH10BAC2_38400 [soil metagenome]